MSQELVVVSAFGRGHWLAADLKDRGHKVSLVDVTGQLGRWAPEDREGPFGFFQSDRLSASQLERLSEEDYYDVAPNGFVAWLPSGPLEARGPLTAFSLGRSTVPESLVSYLNNYEGLSSEERHRLRQDFLQRPFAEIWLGHLCHQLSACQFQLNPEGLNHGEPLPLFATHCIRRVSRRGFNESLTWCENKGVTMFTDAQVIDLSISDRALKHLEIKGGRSGVVQGQKTIWLLSSKETEFLGKDLHQRLFPAGAIDPEWAWLRYRFHVAESPSTQQLPPHFVMIKDIHLPWSHENLVILQKTVKVDQFDLWVRVPNLQRFQQAYMDQISERCLQLLKARLPSTDVTLLDPPQEYRYAEAELGPTRYPVYSAESFRRWKPARLRNVIFDGPEYWQRHDWNYIFKHHSKLIEDIQAEEEAE